EEILNLVYDSMTQARYRYDHEWQVGDLLIWDNRCLVHSVNMDFPVGQRRLHQRILLRGDRPV
ncbi:MAG: TauD/TfdA family dioxygenase, partial [Rhodospirillaceae bacterium]|nr:TauD/TfdA family dioxygenase [Rhodospirillaceae bacterium]